MTGPLSSPSPSPASAPGLARPVRGLRFRALVSAVGGPRYAFAVAVDAVGTGLLRPFMLLYGIDVLRLPSVTAGLAMTAGVVAGLSGTLPVGRWLDRGARSTAVAASMLVRVLGTALLLLAPAGGAGTVWLFAVAALFLGVGNQAFPVAHAALVATVSQGRDRDAALAAGRSVRNAGLGVGALLATAALTGGTHALRALAACTGLSYLLAAGLAWSVRVRADPLVMPAQPGNLDPRPRTAAAPRMRLLLAANVSYVFCLSVPEVALPLVLVTQLHASPVWAAGVFVANTVLVVAFQVPVTVWMSRFSRRTALVISGIVLSLSYLGFLAGIELGHGRAAPALFGVSLLCTIGEIIYAGSSTALVAATAPPEMLGRALARFQLSSGFSLAISPAVMTALAAHGPSALWASLTAATLLSAAVVSRAGCDP
ncbi:MAG TPA: MFS transporter [Trebonia sp.]|nr:MFS transporter [Trebonia sp.]